MSPLTSRIVLYAARAAAMAASRCAAVSLGAVCAMLYESQARLRVKLSFSRLVLKAELAKGGGDELGHHANNTMLATVESAYALRTVADQLALDLAA